MLNFSKTDLGMLDLHLWMLSESDDGESSRGGNSRICAPAAKRLLPTPTGYSPFVAAMGGGQTMSHYGAEGYNSWYPSRHLQAPTGIPPTFTSTTQTAGLATNSIFFCFLFVKDH